MSRTAFYEGAARGGIAAVLTGLHRDENRLGQALLDLADRHMTEHEIHFIGRDVAAWSREHVRRVAELGRARGLALDPEPDREVSLPGVIKRLGAELLGRRQEPALLLLADLREVHLLAAGVSVDWEMLAQVAQAIEDGDLVALASDCHPQTLRQLRWTNAHLKVLAPQALASAKGVT